MKLANLIQDVRVKNYNFMLNNREINDIKIDSRLVKKGDVFIALKGENTDGNEKINEALFNGAEIIVTDNPLIKEDNVVLVDNARSAYAIMCKNFFGRACDDLKIVGVTGTNGKTTTCHIVKQILESTGAKVGIIGTLGASSGSKMKDTGFTTPDPYILHNLFLQMKQEGREYVVMEASAHALALNKLDGITFDVGVLTNITEDHLDYFKTIDNYAKAKFKLFDKNRIKKGIINGDDSICRQLRYNYNISSFGLKEGNDIYAKNIQTSIKGSKFTCCYKGKQIKMATKLVGEYNIQNVLASVAICENLNVPLELIAESLKNVKPALGRFNVIRRGNLSIIVDFAHTPDGLENVLKCVKKLSKNKLIVIFGCGGNRDRLKRPIMGEIAEKYADEIILTSDNPRYEDPYEIIDEIKSGMSEDVLVIENREQAIEYALTKYKDNEIILIAGKGAEKYQEIMGTKYPYSDYDVIKNFYHKKQIDDNFDENDKKI